MRILQRLKFESRHSSVVREIDLCRLRIVRRFAHQLRVWPSEAFLDRRSIVSIYVPKCNTLHNAAQVLVATTDHHSCECCVFKAL